MSVVVVIRNLLVADVTPTQALEPLQTQVCRIDASLAAADASNEATERVASNETLRVLSASLQSALERQRVEGSDEIDAVQLLSAAKLADFQAAHSKALVECAARHAAEISVHTSALARIEAAHLAIQLKASSQASMHTESLAALSRSCNESLRLSEVARAQDVASRTLVLNNSSRHYVRRMKNRYAS